MLRVAVYSNDTAAGMMIRRYLDRLSEYGELFCMAEYYTSVGDIMCDMTDRRTVDAVIIYRDWDAARMICSSGLCVDVIMVAAGISRKLYDIQPCFIMYEPVAFKTFRKLLLSVSGGTRRYPGFAFQFGRTRYRLSVHDIMYFESDRRLINIQCSIGRYSFYGNIGELERRLSVAERYFVRIQSSYIVNLEYVTKCASCKVMMSDGIEINISAARRADVKNLYNNFVEETRCI